MGCMHGLLDCATSSNWVDRIQNMMSEQGKQTDGGGTFLIGGDVPVRRLGYGTMRLVGEGAWGEPADANEAKRVLRRAVELGVTLIDTADAYGPEIAERLIGEALAPYPAGVVIATKGGITRQGPAKDGVRGQGRLSDSMRGDEFATTQAGTDRFVPAAPHRSAHAAGGDAGRAEAHAGAGKDQAHWAGRGDASGGGGCQKNCGRGECPESIQSGRPAARGDAELVRAGGDWIFAVVSECGRQTAEGGPSGGGEAERAGEAAWGYCFAVVAGVAACSVRRC